MEFFDKLTKKATETYKTTSEKTSNLAKEAKLKISINEHKSKIDSLYEEIGKNVYQNHVNSESVKDFDKIIDEYCIQIDELCDTIEDERKELLTLKKKKQCSNCFCEIELDANYCPNCGNEQSSVNDNE